MTARKTRTLYVREEDQAIWDKAKEVIGESLSTYLTNHLRTVVSTQEAAKQGAERILLNFSEGGILKIKGFFGRWLISPEKRFTAPVPTGLLNIKSFLEPQPPPDYYALAITPKRSIVVFKFHQKQENGKFGDGELHIFDSFEAASSSPFTPNGLVAAAMEVLGVEVEELDI